MNKLVFALLTLAWSATLAQGPLPKPVPVTADNFLRAESDSVFTGLVAQGGFGKFFHNRVPVAPDNRIVQRPNRDTLYSTAVFDLDAGPVTITLPEAGKRFETMIVIDEEHYVFTVGCVPTTPAVRTSRPCHPRSPCSRGGGEPWRECCAIRIPTWTQGRSMAGDSGASPPC
jgi:Protein of unknown function (DUF1254)